MWSSWRLLICLCCLLFVCAAVSGQSDEDRDQSSDDDPARNNDRYDIDNAARRLARRRLRQRHQRIPTAVTSDRTVDGDSLTPGRERAQARRRKKLDVGVRRSGRGGGTRGSRRGNALHENSSHVYASTLSTEDDRLLLTTAQPDIDDLMSHRSEVTEVTEVVEVSDVVVETISDDDDDDMMLIMVRQNGTMTTNEDIHQRGMFKLIRFSQY